MWVRVPPLPPNTLMHLKRKSYNEFQQEFLLKNNGLALFQGSTVKYWKGGGLPDYEGSFEGLAHAYPDIAKELLALEALIEC